MQCLLKDEDRAHSGSVVQSGQHPIANTEIMPSSLSQRDYRQGVFRDNLSVSIGMTGDI